MRKLRDVVSVTRTQEPCKFKSKIESEEAQEIQAKTETNKQYRIEF